jgi:asparagine synthetase B (glutamine-hydrolysing)
VGAIAVFLARAQKPEADVVEWMSAAAPHRGSRVESLLHGRCALSCVNTDGYADAGLALLDGFAAGFAGTLDNLAEVADELERRGFPTPERTPAAVIAAAFLVWGEALPSRLRGVFAAAVTDGNRVFCFRDHLGFGLLYCRNDPRGFYAATEPKQIVAGAQIAREPDLDVLERIFFGSVDDETPCALRGVERVPKATLLVSDGEATKSSRYWDPAALLETARLSPDEQRERFDELMDTAVSRCLTGHDAVLMSGGIDSPAVAAYAAAKQLERGGKPPAALSAVYPRYSSVDERRYIELAADRFGMPLHTWEPQANALDDLVQWVTVADGPASHASLALYAESYRVARDHGYRHVLSGELAEFVVTLDGFLLDHLVSHGRVRALRRNLLLQHANGRPWRYVALHLAAAIAPGTVRAARVVRDRNGVPAWLDSQKANEFAAQSMVGTRSRWRKLQLSPLVGTGASLEAEAICQAVCGVRNRRPWADVDLWEFFLSLPAEVKFPETRSKTLVRGLLRGRLPDEILDRRDKTVFDEALLAEIDYTTLRGWLETPEHRLAGVDYDQLGERLRREKLELVDYSWTMSLAAVHAFLSQW